MVPEYSKAALGLHPLIPAYAVDCDENRALCAEQVCFTSLRNALGKSADTFSGSEGLSNREIIPPWQGPGSYLIPALRANCERILLLCDASRAPQK